MYLKGAKIARKKENKAKTKKESNEEKLNHSLRKDYKTMKPLNADEAIIPLNKLSYGIINSHELISFTINGEETQLEESWQEFILLSIYTIMENNPDNYKTIFVDNEVFNSEVSMDKIYGKVSYNRDRQYKVYSLYDTGYYIEAVFKEDVIFGLIISLMNCMGEACTNVMIKLRKKGLALRNPDESTVLNPVVAYSLKEVGKNLKENGDNLYMVSVRVLGETIKSNTIDTALYIILTKLVQSKKLTNDKLETIEQAQKESSNGSGNGSSVHKKRKSGTGIRRKDDIMGINQGAQEMELKNTNYMLYTNKESNGIVAFIKKAAKASGVKPEEIEFNFMSI